MAILYEGARNKLDYAYTKLKNMVDDFYLNGTTTRFTPNIVIVSKLESELFKLEDIIAAGQCAGYEWDLVRKYTAIADEFRTRKATR